MNGATVYWGIGAFVCGVVIEDVFSLGTYLSICFILLAGALAVYSRFAREQLPVGIVVVCLLFAFGGMRMESIHETRDYRMNMEEGYITGTVMKDPDVREYTTNLVVKDVSGVYGTVLVRTDPYTTYQYGDLLYLTGFLERPTRFEDEGRVFHYDRYLAKDGIMYVMAFPVIERIVSGEGNVFVYWLLALKRAYLNRLQEQIPEPAAALAGGITVGDKQSLGDALERDLRATGIIHIVVLSGYNIALIATFMTFLFSRMPPTLGRVCSALGIIVFAILTGGGATVVRASAMGLLVLFAQSTRRVYDALRALCIVGFLMVLWNPAIVVADISFQLSFIATLGIILGMPIVERHVSFLSNQWHIRELVAATIATQIAVAPLILYYMGDFSLIAVLVNALVLPSIAPAMLFVFLTGVLGMTVTVLAPPFAWLSYGLLTYTLTLVDVFARVPFGLVHVGAFPFWIVLSAYVCIGYGVYIWHQKNTSDALSTTRVSWM